MSESWPKDKELNVIKSDFLVIGSGLAGLYAAHYASRFGTVNILTKSTIEESNSYWAQGGIAAAMAPEDSTVFHMEDTVRAGRGLSDISAVDVLVKEGRDRVIDLISLGMEFDSGEKGFELGLEGGHTKRRVLHAGGSATGREMIEFLINAVEANPAITKFESTGVIDILSDSNSCLGALALNNEYIPFEFLAKATILCSGGASALYERTTNPMGSIGEGIALAYRAGAQITDMEFVQFHPTAFYNKSGESFLISEALRGEGAHLISDSGKRFMYDYSELGELAPRDEVSKAIFTEMKNSDKEHVYIDLRHLDPHFVKKRFSNICELCMNFGFDITSDPVPVSPAAHYTIGGVKTDLMGGTNLSGLFACGEVACTGVHGANRLASNSLLECMVFAKRSVDGARLLLSGSTGNADIPKALSLDELVAKHTERDKQLYINNKKKVAHMMNSYVGIVRSEADLITAVSVLQNSTDLLDGLSGYYMIKMNMLLLVSELIAQSALIRQETRGAHIREDYPSEDANWKSHIVLEAGKEPQIVAVR